MGRLGKCELFNHFEGDILVDYDATPTAFLGWVRRNVLRLYTPAAFWVGETQYIASVHACSFLGEGDAMYCVCARACGFLGEGDAMYCVCTLSYFLLNARKENEILNEK